MLELTLPSFGDLCSAQPALIVGQISKWMPSFITPIWVIAAGVLLGAIVCLAVYGVLAILSFFPGLGTLADDPKRGVTVSLVIGALISAFLCYHYVPRESEYPETLFLPLIALGLIAGFGFVYGMWHRTRSEWGTILTEGIVPYVLITTGIITVLGLSATTFVDKPMAFVNSIPEVNLVGDGTSQIVLTVPAAPASIDPDAADFHQMNQLSEFTYDTKTMAELIIESNRTIVFSDAPDPTSATKALTRVNANEVMTYKYENRDVAPISSDPNRLFIQNREIDDATVTLTIKNLPTVPQTSSLVMIAFCFFTFITFVVAFRQAAPRVWALALSTAKNEMAQMLYLILLAMGVFGVVVFSIYPFNTLGDDIRMFKDSSVTLIMILGIIQAVWSAGTTVSDEIEGRTALTVLSKPVSRRSFILGKYAGIMMSVFVMFIVISAFFLILLSYKPLYDARETSTGMTGWALGLEEIMTTVPVLGLYFMQTMVIAAVAVALATRLPLLANFITCFVVYVIGNLTSPLVASTEGNNPLVGFVGKLIAVIVPNLNVFNVQSAVDAGNPIPVIYLAGAFNYLVCFAIAIWMLAMLLFEDRDLA